MTQPKLSPTMRLWLRKVDRNSQKRLPYGRGFGGRGVPERTADALEKLGLVRIVWQPVFLRRESPLRAKYVVPANT